MMTEVFLLILHLAGILVLYKPYKLKDKRKFFCVLDKIPIGSSTPQCLAGIIAHSVALFLILLQLGGYGFYPLSVWAFMVLVTSLYTYKRLEELCRECASTFFICLLCIVLSISLLPYTPYLTFLTYIVILTIALCITAYS